MLNFRLIARIFCASKFRVPCPTFGKKNCLFGGYVGKSAKDILKWVWDKNHNCACASDKRVFFDSVKRRKNHLLTLRKPGCFVECVSFKQASPNNQKFGFQFPVLCGFRLAYKKKIVKK